MQEFINALIQIGATNVELQSNSGYDNHDSLHFQIKDKIFTIDSMRGGEILKGSLLDLAVINSSKID